MWTERCRSSHAWCYTSSWLADNEKHRDTWENEILQMSLSVRSVQSRWSIAPCYSAPLDLHPGSESHLVLWYMSWCHVYPSGTAWCYTPSWLDGADGQTHLLEQYLSAPLKKKNAWCSSFNRYYVKYWVPDSSRLVSMRCLSDSSLCLPGPTWTIVCRIWQLLAS